MRHTPQHKAETRARLLQSAAKAAKRSGIAAASVDRIAQDAGISGGGISPKFALCDYLAPVLSYSRLALSSLRRWNLNCVAVKAHNHELAVSQLASPVATRHQRQDPRVPLLSVITSLNPEPNQMVYYPETVRRSTVLGDSRIWKRVKAEG